MTSLKKRQMILDIQNINPYLNSLGLIKILRGVHGSNNNSLTKLLFSVLLLSRQVLRFLDDIQVVQIHFFQKVRLSVCKHSSDVIHFYFIFTISLFSINDKPQ